MKPAPFLAMLLASVVASTAVHAGPAHEGPSISIPTDQITFGPTGVKTAIGELYAGPVYGDLAHGRHGTFIRMPAGFVSPVHTHTEDYFAVVLQGIGGNGLPDGADTPLPQGSYWFQKGEEAHVTKCLSTEDCLFFLYQPGAFDYLPAG